MKAHGDVTNLGGTELQEPSEDEDIGGPSIVLDQETNAEAEVDLVAEADKVFDSWMNFSPKFNDFLIEGATIIVINGITGRVTFGDIVSKFDTRKYFCTHGFEAYPLTTLMAMVNFSTMFNGGFQERTCSSCKHVIDVGQARVPLVGNVVRHDAS